MNIHELISKLGSEHELSYFNYDRNSDFSLPYSIKMEMKYHGQILKSWGVSGEKDLAYLKCFIELIERVTIRHSCSINYKKASILSKKFSLSSLASIFNIPTSNLYPQNSNGAGCGLNQRTSRTSAKHEMIERHTILSCILLGIPPVEVDSNLLNFQLPAGVSLSSFYWKLDGFFISVCVAEIDNGFLFGHACSQNLSSSLQKSFEELIPNIIHDLTNKLEIKPVVLSVEKDNISSFSTYWRYSGDRRIFNFLKSRKDKNCSDWKRIPKIKNIYYCELEIPSLFKEVTPKLVCSRAISPDAQQLFFDNWKDEYINKRIFEEVKLPSYPHFIA